MPDGELSDFQLSRPLRQSELVKLLNHFREQKDPTQCIIRTFETDYGIAAFCIAWEPAVQTVVATPLESTMEGGQCSTAELYHHSDAEFKADVKNHFQEMGVPLQPIVYVKPS